MNPYPHPPARLIFPAATGFRQRSRWLGIFKLAASVVTGVLVLLAVSVLEAADPKVTNVVAGSPASSWSAKNSTVTTNGFNVLDDKYKLVIGDQLSFWIVEDKEVDGHDTPVNLAVTDSGDVQVPYIGRYPVVGKTCKELSLALKQELEKDYYKRATVIVAVDSKPRSRGKIYLVGAIGAPGPQDVPSDETLTLSKAILRAGGLTSFAKGTAVQVTRSVGPPPGEETKIIVNVTQILEKGKTDLDLTLQPGDLIFVPERMIRF
jgi:protein involved in polysaccharide export with SLBB domain